jgi:hypothetical protein
MTRPGGDPPTPEGDAADAALSEALEAELGALEALLPDKPPAGLPDDAEEGDAGEQAGGDAPA